MAFGAACRLKLQRFPDWPTRLDTAITKARTRLFDWGTWDCCLFPVDVVEALTGVDFATEYRGRYHSRSSATRIMNEIAGGGVDAVATRALGDPLPSPMMAQRGDVVELGWAKGRTLGICIGARIAVAGEAGLMFFPITDAVKAWRV